MNQSTKTTIERTSPDSNATQIMSSDNHLEEYFEKVKVFEAEIQRANQEYIKSFEQQMARHQELLNKLVSQQSTEDNLIQSNVDNQHQDFDLGQSINNLLDS